MLKRVLAFLLSILLLPTTALAAEDTRMEPLSTMESALGGLSVLPVTAPLTPCAVTSFLLHVPGFALAVQTAESINYTAESKVQRGIESGDNGES